MKTIVTTARKQKRENEILAENTAVRLNIPFVPRRNDSIEELRERYQAEAVLVAKEGLLRLETAQGEFFFHPNMAHLRLKNLRFTDQGDRMVEAMGLEAGMTVLDCTLGMATDAIVASFVVGEKGVVTGIESSPLVAEVIGYGLQHFPAENYPIQEAMRRIRTVQAEALDFLRAAETGSYDIVYFDPMFRHPLMDSRPLRPLRAVANDRPVSAEMIREACRVAKRRVVLKENARSLEFQRLGFPDTAGGKYSKIRYGVMDLQN